MPYAASMTSCYTFEPRNRSRVTNEPTKDLRSPFLRWANVQCHFYAKTGNTEKKTKKKYITVIINQILLLLVRIKLIYALYVTYVHD